MGALSMAKKRSRFVRARRRTAERQERRPTQEPTARPKGLARPAREIERVDVIDDQPVGEAKRGPDIVTTGRPVWLNV
jgi:hypothetical protein